MLTRRYLISAAALSALCAAGRGSAQNKLKVVATFSILGDLVKNVGGDRVEVSCLVGPNGDIHVYSPSSADAKKALDADILFANGLGFEGWLSGLIRASGIKAPMVVASSGIRPLLRVRRTGQNLINPHAWQSVPNVKVYIANIRDGLIAVDPSGKAAYEANAAAYSAQLDAIDDEVIDLIAKIPPERRRVITTHDAFGYFSVAYGVTILGAQGVSTEAEASANDVANLITQIEHQHISAVLMDNISQPYLIERIAKESGAKIGGTLYSDALSEESGPAHSYIDMIRHNVQTLSAALAD
jgi:zinc/manganese transport system substrate-binding protein